MATPPFTSAFVTRLESRTQVYRLDCIVDRIVAFRFYCCGNPPLLGVDKAPVCIMSVTPEVQCTGVNVIFNIDASYSPTGNLAGQPWEIDFDDGAPASGNWGPPGNQNHIYATAGTYIAEAYVTDTLGVQGSTEVSVQIIDCANDSVLIEQMYALSATTGPWIRDMTALVPAWAQRIAGLTGNWLNGRSLALDPHRRHLPAAGRHIWIATQAGPAKSVDNMVSWSKLYTFLNNPRNTAGDFVPPTKADLDFWCITFNPLVRDEVYILAGTATRAWIYWSLNGGTTWDNWECCF